MWSLDKSRINFHSPACIRYVPDVILIRVTRKRRAGGQRQVGALHTGILGIRHGATTVNKSSVNSPSLHGVEVVLQHHAFIAVVWGEKKGFSKLTNPGTIIICVKTTLLISLDRYYASQVKNTYMYVSLMYIHSFF